MNTDALDRLSIDTASGTEDPTKLHRWAGEDPARRFDDLFNLVLTPRSWWWRGSGSGATGARARRGSTA